MKLSEIIKLKNCPDWLKNSDIKVSNENIELDSNNKVVWQSGTWESGVWKDGTFENGLWENGDWENGYWENGYWENGIWESGTWLNGTWKNGTWKNGTWENGTFENGVWENGDWYNGNFLGGIAKKGRFYIPKTSKSTMFLDLNTRTININGKEKSVQDWDNSFYYSDEHYMYKRNSDEYRRMIISYEIAKLMIKIVKGS